MTGCHLGHDVSLNNHNVVANACLLGGHVSVGDRVFLGGGAVFHQFVKIGKNAMVGGMSGLEKNLVPYGLYIGIRANMKGDAFLTSELKNITKKVSSLGFFEDVSVEKKPINENFVDIDINIKENQTGTFTAGASFGTLDGVTLVTGLNESNFGGTGRAFEFMINNSDKNNEYNY